jgi:hypothetical protein
MVQGYVRNSEEIAEVNQNLSSAPASRSHWS